MQVGSKPPKYGRSIPLAAATEALRASDRGIACLERPRKAVRDPWVPLPGDSGYCSAALSEAMGRSVCPVEQPPGQSLPGRWDSEILAYLEGHVVGYLRVARDRRRLSGCKVAIDGVVGTLAPELAAVGLQVFQELASLHWGSWVEA